MLTNILTIAALATTALAHGDHESQVPIAGPHKALWYNTLPGDGGTQVYQLIPNSVGVPELTLDRPIPSSQAFLPSVVFHTTHAWHPTT
jgi:hypothetical protein